jgi:hypothetical protein
MLTHYSIDWFGVGGTDPCNDMGKNWRRGPLFDRPLNRLPDSAAPLECPFRDSYSPRLAQALSSEAPTGLSKRGLFAPNVGWGRQTDQQQNTFARADN